MQIQTNIIYIIHSSMKQILNFTYFNSSYTDFLIALLFYSHSYLHQAANNHSIYIIHLIFYPPESLAFYTIINQSLTMQFVI